MKRKDDCKVDSRESIKLLSPDVKSYLKDMHQLTIAHTIRDGKLTPDSPQYLPPDVLSIVKHHQQVLLDPKNKHNLTGKDAQILDCYTFGQEDIIRRRTLTKAMTDFMEQLTDVCMHIGLWITHEYCPDLRHITVHVTSRRKDIFGSELKLLLKSVELVHSNPTIISPPKTRDDFGVRIILDQTDDPEILLKVIQITINILTNPHSKEHLAFYEWVQTTNIYGGAPIPRVLLLSFKDYLITLSNEKNYVEQSKPNGYETWQATGTIAPGSPTAEGMQFEIQGRTSKMHEKAEYGADLTEQEKELGLAHFDYKKELDELKAEIYSFDDYAGGILYFNPKIGYDEDGVLKSKHILARTSSIHLVSKK